VIATIIATTAILRWFLTKRRLKNARAPRARVGWLRGKISTLTSSHS
jgi:hypothetical protein